MSKSVNKLVGVFIAGILFFACGSSQQEKTESTAIDTITQTTQPPKELKVYSLPSPMQIASAIKELKLKYSEDMLNPTNKSTANFPTNYLKAINLGVLGIDMGYAVLYEQKQTAINYFSLISKLGNELNISAAFDPSIVKRFEKNVNNQDSLTPIILNSFNDASTFLNNNNRKDASILILTGGFIEGLHLVVNMAKKNKSKEIYNLIGEQKMYLANLIEILPGFKEQQQEIDGLTAKLNEVKNVFDGITVHYAESTLTDVKLASDVNISDEQLAMLMEKTSDLRKSIMQ